MTYDLQVAKGKPVINLSATDELSDESLCKTLKKVMIFFWLSSLSEREFSMNKAQINIKKKTTALNVWFSSDSKGKKPIKTRARG